MKDVVFEIEMAFPEARDIQINGTNMWPFIRIMFRYLIVEKKLQTINSNKRVAIQNSKFWDRIKVKVAPNLLKWFKKYDVVIFSNDLEKKLIGEKYIDKLSEGIVEQIGFGQSLTINYISGINVNVRSLRNVDSVDGLLINRLSRIIKVFTKISINVNDKAILNKIISLYNLEWADLELRIRLMIAQTYILKLFLKILRPKYVITSCYSAYSEIWAAKQSGIKTIELQHGVISPLHPGYESLYRLNKDFTADYLFTFGLNSLKGLDSNIINRENAFVVGSYYLECLEKIPKSMEILKLIGSHSKSICIPIDYLTELQILEFISAIAKQTTDVIFLVVPRTNLSERAEKLIANCDNIIVVTRFSFQDVVRHCTFHTATNSTCCLEALFFGIPNILIDVDKSVRELFGGKVSDEFTKFASTPDEYLEILKNWKLDNREVIKESNKDNFAYRYKSNLTEALKKVGAI